MNRRKSSLWLLTGLFFCLVLPMIPGPVEAKKSNRCEGTKKQRKQKMELRDLTDEQFGALLEQYKKTVSAEREQIAQTVLRRLEREYQEHQTSGEPFIYDVLIISGGGPKGAFGAGFLEGWGTVESGPTKRPEFDAVTGVSTGALIAPFAFTGTHEAYHKVADFYANPEPNWVRERGKFSFLPHHVSLFNNCHLQDTIREKVDETLVQAVAEGDRVRIPHQSRHRCGGSLGAIPQDGPKQESEELFDRQYMIQLEELGREMGADPSVWRTEVPSAYSFDRD